MSKEYIVYDVNTCDYEHLVEKELYQGIKDTIESGCSVDDIEIYEKLDTAKIEVTVTIKGIQEIKT